MHINVTTANRGTGAGSLIIRCECLLRPPPPPPPPVDGRRECGGATTTVGSAVVVRASVGSASVGAVFSRPKNESPRVVVPAPVDDPNIKFLFVPFVDTSKSPSRFM